MLSPVSMVSPRVHFGEAAPANTLERPGAFAKPAEQAAAAPEAPKAKKKGHSLRNTIIGLVVTAAALVALKKTDVLKTLDKAVLADTKYYNPKKLGHYLAVAGEFIAKYTYDPVAKLCTKIFKNNKAAS